eukprot:6189621-Pleurochrysis_carterae.AAC.1
MVWWPSSCNDLVLNSPVLLVSRPYLLLKLFCASLLRLPHATCFNGRIGREAAADWSSRNSADSSRNSQDSADHGGAEQCRAA